MKIRFFGALASIGLAACTSTPQVANQEGREAVRLPEATKPVQLIEVPQLLPLPGQLKVIPALTDSPTEAADPIKRVNQANDSARVQPSRANFINANQVWPYSADALYQVYASPEKITDIALQAGEELVSVSAGDTIRWIIGDTTSGAAGAEHVHILVKPTRADLKTNLVITSNRRAYHVELTATPQTWMSSVSWSYPLDQLMILKSAAKHADETAPVAQGVALERLNFHYTIRGDSPSWKPLRAFDDGEKVYIQFPASIGQSELPPLFIIGADRSAELVNYRVRTPYYIVDRLFAAAELRLGVKPAMRVRIEREPAPPMARTSRRTP